MQDSETEGRNFLLYLLGASHWRCWRIQN